MKFVKTGLSLLLCGALVFGFAGCGEKKGKDENTETSSESKGVAVVKTELYSGIDLTPCVSFGPYKGMKVNPSVVEDGDIANIDYCGKKDGVAFDGGTAQGHDLTIGSHSFIDGFESGLIGVKVGDTVDLNLKFPDQYQSEELAGQEVVFTVTVNSVQKPFVNRLVTLATINSYPEDPKVKNCELVVLTDAYYKTQGMSLETMTQYTGMNINVMMEQMVSNGGDVDTMLSQLKSEPSFKAATDRILICYALFQKENLGYDTSKLDGLTDYERAYTEYQLVEKAVNDFLEKNAVKE